jgi:hypothetical protein
MRNWKKLSQVMNYLNSMIDLILTSSFESLSELAWCIDGFFAVHSDMKGQSDEFLMTDGCALLAK